MSDGAQKEEGTVWSWGRADPGGTPTIDIEGLEKRLGRSVVVDTTCSTKRLWPKFADIRLDVNPEVHPDVVADTRRLPFHDNCIGVLYCDPPHLVKSDKNHFNFFDDSVYNKLNQEMKKGINGYRRFFRWHGMKEYRSWLNLSATEFYRVLKPGGVVHYKTTDGSRSHGNTIRVDDAKEVFCQRGFVLMEDDVHVSTGYLAKLNTKHYGSVTLTHYLIFQKPLGEVCL